MNRKKKIPILGINIDGELLESIIIYCKEQDITICDFMEQAANEFLIRENC